jgi:hypothetical protein
MTFSLPSPATYNMGASMVAIPKKLKNPTTSVTVVRNIDDD